MSALVSVAEVRTAGSLGSATDTGSVEDAQVTEAIKDASERMQAVVGSETYEEVVAYDPGGPGATAALTKRKNDFKEAEARFAVSDLTQHLSGAQLAKTGLQRRRETGKSTTEFASVEEVRNIRRDWDAKAYRWLADYLATDVSDEDDDQIGVRTKDRKLGIAAL